MGHVNGMKICEPSEERSPTHRIYKPWDSEIYILDRIINDDFDTEFMATLRSLCNNHKSDYFSYLASTIKIQIGMNASCYGFYFTGQRQVFVMPEFIAWETEQFMRLRNKA
jgi:hypothetical protein